MVNITASWQEVSTQGSLVVGVFTEGQPDCLSHLDEETVTQLQALLEDSPSLRKFKTTTAIHTLGRSPFKRIYFVGLGDEQEFNDRRLKQAVGNAIKVLEKDDVTQAVFAFDSFVGQGLEKQYVAHAVAEAIGMASYHFADYKKRDEERVTFNVTLFSENGHSFLAEAVKTGSAYAQGVNVARSLVNTPANYLTPMMLANHAIDIAEKYGMNVEVLDENELKAMGMGALLGVSQGSDEPPRLIVIKYQGKTEWSAPLTFVGKGVTYDSGGYSLKTAQGMMKMKTDMGGAASVLGALTTIGELKPAVNVMGVIPTTENLVNGSAMKPGDVLTASNGKTIEVNNTDAEGRLILADALAYSVKNGAGKIIDLATLTGAIVVTFGPVTTGAVTNNDSFYQELKAASEATSEWIWELPHHEPYKEMVRQSDVADLINSPGRGAGSITAAMFLHEFVGDDTPWVHLDIAGTAYSDKPSDLGPVGATGVMVRTLAELARTSE